MAQLPSLKKGPAENIYIMRRIVLLRTRLALPSATGDRSLRLANRSREFYGEIMSSNNIVRLISGAGRRHFRDVGSNLAPYQTKIRQENAGSIAGTRFAEI